MSPTLFFDLTLATGQTLYMVFMSTLGASLLGLPLGTMLFITASINPQPRLHRYLNALVNISRSIPFIILLVALIPFTRFIVGTSIGINAAIIPLTLGAAPLFARLVDTTYQQLPYGLIEAGQAMGVSIWQMIWHILLPEGRSALIHALTMTAITLVNYSAMAGTIGGGGLGDLAIRYGYQRFDAVIMASTLIILIIIVQSIQAAGDKLAHYFSKGGSLCAH